MCDFLLISQLSSRKLQEKAIKAKEEEEHVLKDDEEKLKPDDGLRSEQGQRSAAGRRRRKPQTVDLVQLGPVLSPWREELLNKARDKARPIRIGFKM